MKNVWNTKKKKNQNKRWAIYFSFFIKTKNKNDIFHNSHKTLFDLFFFGGKYCLTFLYIDISLALYSIMRVVGTWKKRLSSPSGSERCYQGGGHRVSVENGFWTHETLCKAVLSCPSNPNPQRRRVNVIIFVSSFTQHVTLIMGFLSSPRVWPS